LTSRGGRLFCDMMMRKVLCAITVGLLTIGAACGAWLSAGGAAAQTLGAQIPAAPGGYELVWSDEFNGPDGALPDAAKWTYDIGGEGWGNHELEFYTNHAQNARMEGGNLVITAQKETTVTAKGETRMYTSARIRTQGLFSQRYGRFEARVKIPKGEGMWPAFWMLGDDISTVGWPKCGEIDIMENIGKEPAVVHGSLHGFGHGAAGPETGKVTADLTSTFSLPGSPRLADDFHVYAVEWDKEAIRFFIDDKNYATFTREQWPAGAVWPFEHKFFVILNLAVGGDWPGPPDSTTVFPQQMLVDYVRVYERKVEGAKVER
jgi:beta-glucanase (GH16 family)